ncbi:PREDICTED: coagulation factor IX-like [Wasmannia auropunctata]|uniref:coagulation factor IX-like n=1 Tax=Wasmannia auropunctata TaxID=64793 RepID=UPI0005EFF106|nr:PREDICTED: coagulation factor IX-like [Wasmannia auropunctata]
MILPFIIELSSNRIRFARVKHIYTVRNYQGVRRNYLGDIALLELVTPFVFSTWLVPVCIDTVLDKNIWELVGSYGKVPGFGKTATGEISAILQSLTIPVIPLRQCISATESANARQFLNDKFCAGYTNG